MDVIVKTLTHTKEEEEEEEEEEDNIRNETRFFLQCFTFTVGLRTCVRQLCFLSFFD